MNFRVDLNIFRGPLDLLLFLVRKHEIETPEIPIALITEQFLEYLTVLEEIDVDGVGDNELVLCRELLFANVHQSRQQSSPSCRLCFRARLHH